MTDTKPICPKCGGFIPNNETPGAYKGAISRTDNKTEICSSCGNAEAMEDFFGYLNKKGVATAKPVEADWSCPTCGATKHSAVRDCCDYCLLSLFSGLHSPDLDTAFLQYNSTSDWESDTTDYSEENN